MVPTSTTSTSRTSRTLHGTRDANDASDALSWNTEGDDLTVEETAPFFPMEVTEGDDLEETAGLEKTTTSTPSPPSASLCGRWMTVLLWVAMVTLLGSQVLRVHTRASRLDTTTPFVETKTGQGHSDDDVVNGDDDDVVVNGDNDDSTDSHDNSSWLQELAAKTPLSIPLQPPFRIVETGVHRTGSTFQFHLLDAIAQLKSQGTGYNVTSLGYSKKRISWSTEHTKYVGSFVVKSHNGNDSDLAQAQKEGKLVSFTSGYAAGDPLYESSLYNQEFNDLLDCSLCQVNAYREIFGLTDEDVETVKAYMATYENIRRCCGLQMSHYEQERLLGCNMTSVDDLPNNPHCERIDKQELEQEMLRSPIPHRAVGDDHNWAEPGDCARFDAMVLQGLGMGGELLPKKCEGGGSP
jgi:hypothetical protein